MVYTDGIHMIADNIGELHMMAGRIGVGPWWFHNGSRHPHYDLYRDKVLRQVAFKNALALGAIKCTSRELVRISNHLNYEES